MSEQEFWAIVESFNWDYTGDDELVVEPAVRTLAEKSVEEIYSFEDHLSRLLYALDTREHARYAFLGEADPDNGDHYISSDEFLYIRCVVVDNGEKYYKKVLNQPRSMPKDLEFEHLLYVAGEAYERKTGTEYNYFCREWDRESFSNAQGWAPAENTREGLMTSDQVPPGNRRPV